MIYLLIKFVIKNANAAKCRKKCYMRRFRSDARGNAKLIINFFWPKTQILGYTPCTGGLQHPDEAIFGIFLIVMNPHRHSEGSGSIFRLWPSPTNKRPPCLLIFRNFSYPPDLIWNPAYKFDKTSVSAVVKYSKVY